MEEKAQLQDPVKHGRIQRILKKMMGICALDSSGSQLGQVVGSCEYGNEPSGSV
jgi:hypothetical protein